MVEIIKLHSQYNDIRGEPAYMQIKQVGRKLYKVRLYESKTYMQKLYLT